MGHFNLLLLRENPNVIKNLYFITAPLAGAACFFNRWPSRPANMSPIRSTTVTAPASD